ncbi:MAG: MBL fold metallo-hydrolase [Alphaproteobacteria bacterium BRH_c36]|nr:MAG: MBL fold metallo-hydrolase [Alphaproteobacteria bacterium BRH_c36]
MVTRRLACLGLVACGGGAALSRLATPLQAGEIPAAKVAEIADGVFVHRGQIALQSPANHADISNAGFVVGTDAVAVIDTGGSYHAGAALRAAVAKHTKAPIRYVINTHMHPDHVLGNAAFKADKPRFIAHHKMKRALSARTARYLEAAENALGDEAFEGTEVVLPDAGVEDVDTLDLGGRTLRLAAQPTAHTDNDLVITDQKTGTAFVGDLIFSGHVPALDGSIVGWIEVLEKLGHQAPALIVPGHGPAALSWAAGSEPVQRYLRAVAHDVRAIIKRGGTISEAIETAGISEASGWELFDEFHKRNVTAAFAELEWE